MSMLSRVAENLFWIGRYVERAENTARLLDTGRRMAAIPGPDGNRNEWESILASSGSDDCFPEGGSENSIADVVRHLALSPENPSSIYSSLKAARDNARSTREGLSTDSWKAINDAWHEMRHLPAAQVTGGMLADLIDRTKLACMAIVGSIESTVLRNETYHFIRLGTYSERADSTARILDVKYFSLLPEGAALEGGVDIYQWMTILHATATRRLYRSLYGSAPTARLVAEMLIQNKECARSLAFSVMRLQSNLADLGHIYGTGLLSFPKARRLSARLTERSIDDVIVSGLHEFLGDFIIANNSLALQIAKDFHFAPSAPSTQAQDQSSA